MDTSTEYGIFHTKENSLKSLLLTLPATFLFIHLRRLSLEEKLFFSLETLMRNYVEKPPIASYLSSGEYSAPSSLRTLKLKHPVATLAYMTSPLCYSSKLFLLPQPK